MASRLERDRIRRNQWTARQAKKRIEETHHEVAKIHAEGIVQIGEVYAVLFVETCEAAYLLHRSVAWEARGKDRIRAIRIRLHTPGEPCRLGP